VKVIVLTKRVEPEFPSITPDIDQVESFKNTRTHANSNAKGGDNTNVSAAKTNTISKQGNPVWLILLTLIIAITLGLSITWFYQEHSKSQELMLQYQQRITLLEQQLSATGEEMGESTVAMKVRLETLTDKSEKLWQEMDKLWASAWRRNQSDIKTLRSTSVKNQQKTSDSIQKLSTTLTAIDQLKEKITANDLKINASDLKINALGDNLSGLNVINAELDKLKSELSSLTQQSFGRDNQQIEIASSVNELDTLIQLLVERIESLELKLAASNALPKIQTPTVDTAAIND
jgi:chromosome segregation ATPase